MHRIPMNNNLLRKVRGEAVYQAVIIDLANAGLIDKDSAENLLGYKFLDAWGKSQYVKPIHEVTVEVGSLADAVNEEVAEKKSKKAKKEVAKEEVAAENTEVKE